MTNLSPATQAIIDASNCAGSRCVQLHIAAALRAAADLVVPEQGCQIYGLTERENERQQVREEILAIAAELEESAMELTVVNWKQND